MAAVLLDVRRSHGVGSSTFFVRLRDGRCRRGWRKKVRAGRGGLCRLGLRPRSGDPFLGLIIGVVTVRRGGVVDRSLAPSAAPRAFPTWQRYLFNRPRDLSVSLGKIHPLPPSVPPACPLRPSKRTKTKKLHKKNEKITYLLSPLSLWASENGNPGPATGLTK